MIENDVIIKTFVYNYSHELEEYYTVKKTKFLSIDDPLAGIAAKKILEENNLDYLAGYIFLSYDGKPVFTEERTETECLLTTWLDLARILREEEDKEFEICFLDNADGNAIIKKEAGNYVITLQKRKQGPADTFTIPAEKLKEAVRKNFVKFIGFCRQSNLVFSKESLYSNALEEYEKIKG